MSVGFVLLTIVFTVISVAMILIILVQRPQGGGLAGAFGGAGGSSTETVFGGRVGDALTIATTIAFLLWMGIAISLNLMSAPRQQTIGTTGAEVVDEGSPASGEPTQQPEPGATDAPAGTGFDPTQGFTLPTDADAGAGDAAPPAEPPIEPPLPGDADADPDPDPDADTDPDPDDDPDAGDDSDDNEPESRG